MQMPNGIALMSLSDISTKDQYRVCKEAGLSDEGCTLRPAANEPATMPEHPCSGQTAKMLVTTGTPMA